MKILYLLRGMPASGKSTWIKENNFEKYCLSSDKIRLLFPQIGENITQIYDIQVWNLLYDLMEKRMQIYQDIIIDATHYKKSYIRPYIPYCEKYGYTIKLIDFTNIDLSTCIERNSKRIYDKVPEDIIIKMYNTIKDNKKEIEKDFIIITPEDAKAEINENVNKKYIVKKQDALDFYDKVKNITDEYRSSDKELNDEINVLRDLVLKTFPFLNIEHNFEHNNKYHYRNVLDHSIEVMIFYTDFIYKLGLKLDLVYLVSCLLHDIGKPLVMFEGKDGYRHFYGHGATGKKFFDTYIREQLVEVFTKEELDLISEIVKDHDEEIEPITVEFALLQLSDAEAHYDLKDENNTLGKRKERIKNILKKMNYKELK